MAIITYNNIELEHISIQGLYKISDIESGKIQKVTIEIPAYKEYQLLFTDSYYDVTITHESEDYLFSIYGNPQIDNTKIKIDLYPKIQKTLDSKISIIINKNAYNPIQAIIDVLNELSIGYDKYTFQSALQLRSENNVEMEIAFIPSIMEMSYNEFFDEILNRVGCVKAYDVVNNQLYLIDYFKERNIFLDYIDYNLISYADIKTTYSQDFYNSFNIGIYPILSAKDVYEYEYETVIYDTLSIQRTVFIHESLLTVSTIVQDTPTQMKYDFYIDGFYFQTGSIGKLTGLRRLYSVGLESKTIQMKQKSLAENNNTEKIWNDTKNNNDGGLIKQSNLNGAFWIGNKIIQTMYNKRTVKEFEYPEKININVGDFVIFNNLKAIVISKTLNADFLNYSYKLEEVLL